jgi:hypothetical protein
MSNLRSAYSIFVFSSAVLAAPIADAAELLILSGSDGQFIRDCNQMDVVISGSRSKFVLTGGCQSVSVPGDGNQILVEIAAGAEIHLRGNENNLAWKPLPGVADPAIVAEGRANTIAVLGGASGKAETAPAIANRASGATVETAALAPVETRAAPIIPTQKAFGNSKNMQQSRPYRADANRKAANNGSGAKQSRDGDNEVALSFDAAGVPLVSRCHRTRDSRQRHCETLAPASSFSTPSAGEPAHHMVWRVLSDDPTKLSNGARPVPPQH